MKKMFFCLMFLFLTNMTIADNNGQLYWADTMLTNIQKVNIDGSGKEEVVYVGGEIWQGPRDIALDPIHQKMYWSDSTNQVICRANLDGSESVAIKSVGDIHSQVCLDLERDMFFWTEHGSTLIKRANLDGTGEETIASSLSMVSDLKIDPVRGILYWSEPFVGNGIVTYSNLDGSGREVIIDSLNMPEGIAIDPIRGNIFLADQTPGLIYKADLDGSNLSVFQSFGSHSNPVDMAIDLTGELFFWSDAVTETINRSNLDGTNISTIVHGVDVTSGIAYIPEPGTVDVRVDIKPESCPNPLVVKGRGVLTAAILGSCTLDVQDIDAASVELAGAPAIRSEVRDVGGPAAVQLDSMDNIAARPWTDKRDPQEGTGWLYQDTGSMGIDYGVTNDSAGVPNPLSGWDYLGNWVGVGAPMGCWGDPAICNYWWVPWCNSYYGKFDREISGPFTFAELGILSTSDVIALDVYKTVANSPEHVRELQLYDSLGNRNTYSVQAEATASTTGGAQGWRTYCVPLSAPLENNADLTDIVDIRLWVSSWSFAPNYPGAPWPEYTGGRPTGTPVLIDNLRLVRAHDPDCGDCLTGADGFDDLVLKFNRADIVSGLGAVHHGDVVDLDLTGNLLTGYPIAGVDCVNIVGKADPAQRPPKK